MRTLLLAVPIAALALSACSSESDQPKTMDEVAEEAAGMTQPKAGEYTSTTELIEFNMPGQPPEMAERLKQMMSGQFTQTTTSCLTEEEAAKGFEEKFRDIGEGMNDLKCDFERFDVDGDNVDAKLACSGAGGMSAGLTMAGTVAAEKQTVDMTMNMRGGQIPGGEMQMKMKVVSERTGDCG